MQVLNFGSINQDYVYRVHEIAEPGETVHALSFEISAGGKGANQSIALARAGAKVYHAGKVGTDTEWIKDKLRFNKVDTKHIIVSDKPGGHAVIQVDDRGQNSIVVYGGANREIERNEIDSALGNFGPETILLLQNEINDIPYIIEQAKTKGMTICFNPAPFAREVLDYPLDKVDILVVNETEAVGILGRQPTFEAMDDIMTKYPHMEIIVTRGKYGVIYYSMEERTELPAFMVKPVDATAAGDTFIGYYLAFRDSGKQTRDVLKIAMRAAATCVSRKGAMDSIPNKKEVVEERQTTFL